MTDETFAQDTEAPYYIQIFHADGRPDENHGPYYFQYKPPKKYKNLMSEPYYLETESENGTKTKEGPFYPRVVVAETEGVPQIFKPEYVQGKLMTHNIASANRLKTGTPQEVYYNWAIYCTLEYWVGSKMYTVLVGRSQIEQVITCGQVRYIYKPSKNGFKNIEECKVKGSLRK